MKLAMFARSPGQTILAYQQYGMTTVAPCQMSAQEAAYCVEHMHMLPFSPRVSHEELVYINPYESLPTQLAYQQHQQHQWRRGSQHRVPLAEFAYDHPEMHNMHAPDSNNGVHVPSEMVPHSYHDSMRSQTYAYSLDLSSPHSPSAHLDLPAQGHYHHRLSDYPPPSKRRRSKYSGSVYNVEKHSPPCVVGQPGMPQPALKPKGSKLKFTPEDDALLVELKETKNLMWRQIESFFPGRSSGTLQVRYCTKLKAKSRVWTGDMTKRLRQAVEGYEHNRWCVVSATVGKGFSAAACKEKADELRMSV